MMFRTTASRVPPCVGFLVPGVFVVCCLLAGGAGRQSTSSAYFEFLMARRLEAQGDNAGALAALERAAAAPTRRLPKCGRKSLRSSCGATAARMPSSAARLRPSSSTRTTSKRTGSSG